MRQCRPSACSSGSSTFSASARNSSPSARALVEMLDVQERRVPARERHEQRARASDPACHDQRRMAQRGAGRRIGELHRGREAGHELRAQLAVSSPSVASASRRRSIAAPSMIPASV